MIYDVPPPRPTDTHNPAPESAARHLVHSQTTHILQKITGAPADATAADLLDLLRRDLQPDIEEDVLSTQMHILNSLFHRLTHKALTASTLSGNPIPDYVDDCRIDLALRAQKQCRMTIQALHIIRGGIREK